MGSMSTKFEIPSFIAGYLGEARAKTIATVESSEAWDGNSNLDELTLVAKRTYVAQSRRRGRSFWFARSFGERLQRMIEVMSTETPTMIRIKATSGVLAYDSYVYHEGPSHILTFWPGETLASASQRGLHQPNFVATKIVIGGNKAIIASSAETHAKGIESRLRKALLGRIASLRKEIKDSPRLLEEIEASRGAKKMVKVVDIAQELSACRGSLNTLLEGINKESLTKQSLDNFFELIRKLSAKKGAIRRDLKKFYGA